MNITKYSPNTVQFSKMTLLYWNSEC